MRNKEESLERTIMVHNMGGAFLESSFKTTHRNLIYLRSLRIDIFLMY